MTSAACARLRGGMLLASACALILLAGLLLAGTASASNPGWALINGDSVTLDDNITDAGGTPISLEQFAAQNAGFTHVDVVDGATWDAMTPAQFAQYQVLIIGDPDCGGTTESANSNASTWAPVVMGSGGNRAVVGTDPEDHYADGGGGAAPTNPADPTTAGAEHLVQGGIAFAGGVAGATGAYYDTSCQDSNSPDIIPVLDQLTTAGPGNWVENASPPCGGDVSLIASVAGFNSGPTRLTTHDIEGWGCSVHIAFPTFPPDWNPVAVATDTPTQPTCGSDPDTGTPACGQAYVLVSGSGIVATAPDLKLDPLTGNDPVGATHTVTATITQAAAPSGDVLSARSARAAGDPDVGKLVSFAVSGANAGAVGTCSPNPDCTSDATGKVSFTYTGTKAGADTINASFVNNNDQTEHATASETWFVPPPVVTATAPSISRAPIVCVSTRRFVIHVQRARRYHLVSASVFVNGKRVKVTRHASKRHPFTAIVDLRNLKAGTYHVLVVGRSRSGKVRRFTRTYHTCAKKRPGGHPKL